MIVILFLFMTVTFLIIQAMPGDIAGLYIDPKVTPEAREAMRKAFGLDQPLHIQYVRYMASAFTGNFGISFSHYPTPVWEIILQRLPRTVVLFLTSTIVSFYIGFAAGKVIAWRSGGKADHAATLVGITFWTAFYPLLALIVIWIFGYRLGWLPLNQFIDPMRWLAAPISANAVFERMLWTGAGFCAAVGLIYLAAYRFVSRPAQRRLLLRFGTLAAASIPVAAWALSPYGTYAWDILRHMILPVLTLALINFGGTMLLTRDSMLETIREDYVTAARAKGLPERVVRDRYAARTALLPVVTSFALNLGGVAGGGVVTETVFSWPGLGQTLLDASIMMDYPLAIGAFTFTGIFVLFAHLVADVLYAVLDPRLRTGAGV